MGMFDEAEETRVILYVRCNTMEDAIALANAIAPWREKMMRPQGAITNDLYWTRRVRKQNFILAQMVPGEEYTMTQLAKRAGVPQRGFSYKTFQRNIKELAANQLITLRVQRTGGKGAATIVTLTEQQPGEVK